MAAAVSKEVNEEVTDGESELRQLTTVIQNHPNAPMDVCYDPEQSQHQVTGRMVSFYTSQLVPIFLHGIVSWTTESRIRYLRGLYSLISLLRTQVLPYLPDTLQSLSAPIRDDESAVRAEAERCCAVLGQLVPSDVILELLIPRLLGNLSGYDTAPARTSALLLATHLLTGLTSSSNFTSELSSNLAQVLSSTLSNSSFYLFDDILVHEAALLLIQGILRNLPSPCRTTEVQYHLLLALLYLQSCGQVTQRDKVVIEAARHEIVQLSRLHNLPVGEYDLTHVMDTKTSSSTQSKSQVLASLAIATRAVCSASSNKMETDVVEEIDIFTKYSVEVDSVLTDHFVLLFEYLSSQMQNHTSATLESKALDTLLRMSPRLSWKHGDLVFPVIIPWVQPPPCQQSQQQSDTSNVESMMHHIDTRLTLLALVETLVRAASSNWQCAPHLRRHSEAILKQIVVPNLVWRAGRIEGAIRKVAMAVGYAVLKAGAVESETLLVSATELVPLIVSHLDDSDTTCRLIACPALQILFERLRGSFSPQAVHEIYPKLLKRLDDSCDEVRIAVLESLHFFFKCGPPSYFTGTLIDYSLDQLFIHLDDPNVIVQNTVMATILSTVSIDKDLIVEKAESNRSVHRAPLFCDKILNEILKV